MRVLAEQDVSTRRRRLRGATGRGRTGRRDRQSRRRGLLSGSSAAVPGRIVTRIRTIALTVLTLALAVALALLVPQLEAEAEGSAARDDAGLLHAEGPSLPSVRAGLVEFERTDDTEYIVSEGETLSEIANRFDVDLQALARYNDLSDPNSISADQRIVIPGTMNRSLRPEE